MASPCSVLPGFESAPSRGVPTSPTKGRFRYPGCPPIRGLASRLHLSRYAVWRPCIFLWPTRQGQQACTAWNKTDDRANPDPIRLCRRNWGSSRFEPSGVAPGLPAGNYNEPPRDSYAVNQDVTGKYRLRKENSNTRESIGFNRLLRASLAPLPTYIAEVPAG